MITTWTLTEALTLIRELQPIIRELDYHITLGGSVLNTGKSEKDLDLFIVPLNGYESQPQVIMKALWDNLGVSRALRDSPDYNTEDSGLFHYSEAVMFNYCGKRIDVFIQ